MGVAPEALKMGRLEIGGSAKMRISLVRK